MKKQEQELIYKADINNRLMDMKIGLTVIHQNTFIHDFLFVSFIVYENILRKISSFLKQLSLVTVSFMINVSEMPVTKKKAFLLIQWARIFHFLNTVYHGFWWMVCLWYAVFKWNTNVDNSNDKLRKRKKFE